MRFFYPFVLVTLCGLLFTKGAAAQTLYGSAGVQLNRENAANVDWVYSWSNTPDTTKFNVTDANFEFVPMIWSGNPTGVVSQINRIMNLEANFGVHVDYVMGFNEPELSDQANMSVEEAIATWEVITDKFADTDIKLVSPAVSGKGAITRWLTPFMTEVENRNGDSDSSNDLQVDVIAYHYYTVGYTPRVEAQNLLNEIDSLWAKYQRPIWITEFAGTSYSENNPVHSTEERNEFNREFLQILMPAFDSRDYVERVAWWQFGALIPGGGRYSALSSSSNGVYTPTIIGEEYFRTILESGESYDFAAGETRPSNVHYLKGGTLNNSGIERDEALRALDAIEGSSIISGSSDFGFEFADDAFVRVRENATLTKQGSNLVTLSDLPFFNDGSVIVQDGTLQLEDGAEMSGEGTMRINRDGTLAISGGTNGAEVALDSALTILNGGVLHIKDSRANISKDLRLWTASEVRTDGDLLVSGETSGFGKILSTGPGTLFLNGDGGNANGATVSEGSLVVSNTESSATGAGDVSVSDSGTFGGFGMVDGSLQASSGFVAPGVARSSFGGIDVPQFDEGAVVTAIAFDFTGVQDDAPLMQTSALADGLRLVSGLDFGAGVQPRNAANDGDEFNVSGFSIDNYGGAASGGNYLTFTIAPIPGLAMHIDDVLVVLGRNGSGAATKYGIGTSISGFTFSDRWRELVLDTSDVSTEVFTAENPGTEAVTDDVEIRIVGYAASSAAGNTHFSGVSVNASFTSDPNNVAVKPTGILNIGGDYTQLDFATLQIEMAGSSNENLANAEYDQLIVAGNVQLDGTLDLSFVDDFSPSVGDAFDVILANSISGTFSTVNMPENMDLAVIYGDDFVRVEVVDDGSPLGDLNFDGLVDFSDIGPFIGLLTSGVYSIKADVNLDGSVDFQDIGPFIGLLQN